jgi:(2R)-3-sulfolactate dehydrogenase (NADP+)
VTRAVSLEDATALAIRALLAHGFTHDVAEATAAALILAELDGLSSHGLSRLGFYLAQACTGKVDAGAIPAVERDRAIVRVDGGLGLAFAAINCGIEAGIEAARDHGMAAVGIRRSHHFGVAGHPVERLARRGLIGLAFSNTPAAMAPWGGTKALMGTNPIAFGCPRAEGDPLVIDLSLSKVARGRVMLAKKKGQPIPEGWALDRDGNPATDPDLALKGTMVPAGDAKGAALALMVELLCAGLTGANFAWEASSLFDAEGPPPGLGHLILIIDPAHFGDGFPARAEAMLHAVEADHGARLPGARRYAERRQRGDVLDLPDELVTELEELGREKQADA